MLAQYFPLLIFLAVAAALGIFLLLISRMANRPKPDKAKAAPYECGFDAFDDARAPFDVRFYLVAILFILFDLETAFLFPWAVAYHYIGWLGLGSMLFFLLLLTVGFIYEWRKGALEWE